MLVIEMFTTAKIRSVLRQPETPSPHEINTIRHIPVSPRSSGYLLVLKNLFPAPQGIILMELISLYRGHISPSRLLYRLGALQDAAPSLPSC